MCKFNIPAAFPHSRRDLQIPQYPKREKILAVWVLLLMPWTCGQEFSVPVNDVWVWIVCKQTQVFHENYLQSIFNITFIILA